MVWLTAAASSIVVEVFFPEIYGDLFIVLAVEPASIIAYLALTILARGSSQREGSPQIEQGGDMAKIGFIGLGNMGLPMALNLIKAGYQVVGFDVVKSALAQFAAAKGAVADLATSACADVDVVITMLPAGEHVRAVYLGDNGIIAKAPSKALLIDCSTIDVATTRAVATAAGERGFDMLDAPVSGGVGGAQAATLTFMVGGTEAAFARAQPILSLMGKTIVHAGGSGKVRSPRSATT